ncbi:hypothetical protein [Aliiglaciecola litoralis]|uniref:ATPase F1/V1/A1 complex alpha/beta subunit N-terminal domain-containing protein n=1 Tax=Aliiglaciecola litoralis TaxID=582857 RepID=A0ABP3X2X7_9ALTE
MTNKFASFSIEHWFHCQMDKAFDDVFNDLKKFRESLDVGLSLQQTGTVIKLSDGIALVSGLASVAFEELLKFPYGIYGFALDADDAGTRVVLLGDYSKIEVGNEVKRTRRILHNAANERRINRVRNHLGRCADGKTLG